MNEKRKLLKRLAKHYPDYDFLHTENTRSSYDTIMPNVNQVKKSLMLGKDAIELEVLLRALRRSGAIDVTGARGLNHLNESVEVQIFARPRLGQFYMCISTEQRDTWLAVKKAITRSILRKAEDPRKRFIDRLLKLADNGIEENL